MGNYVTLFHGEKCVGQVCNELKTIPRAAKAIQREHQNIHKG